MKHGKLYTYSRGCRCAACKAIHAFYMRERYAPVKAFGGRVQLLDREMIEQLDSDDLPIPEDGMLHGHHAGFVDAKPWCRAGPRPDEPQVPLPRLVYEPV